MWLEDVISSSSDSETFLWETIGIPLGKQSADIVFW